MSAEFCEPIRRLVAAAPPLTPEQRLRLAVLLRPDLPVGIRKETTPAGALDEAAEGLTP